MIQEVIVVEGKSDIARLRQSVDADVIATEGFCLRKDVLKEIALAYKQRGIIILTDPDSAGERIRAFLAKRFPNARHAFVPQEEALAHNDIGIEQASPESIRKALAHVRTLGFTPQTIFSMDDLFQNDLNGTASAQRRRACLGAILGIGYCNAKRFLHRLNHYNVTRDEWERALDRLNEEPCHE
jgi:ribonuclease M5